MWRLVVTVSLLCCSSEGSVTCRDENNGEVDWFILYKAPINVESTKQEKTTGSEYLYIYPDGPETTNLKKHSKLIDDPKGILANTLRPLFIKEKEDMPQDFGFISYSDQPPRGSNAGKTYGHSKGVVMVDKTSTGVWLLHSTPKFPYKRDLNFWPSTGNKNAQTFICVTFPYDQFQKIGDHLQYIRAYTFDHRIPDDFYDELRKVKIHNYTVPPSSDPQVLKSHGGQEFRSITKQLYQGSSGPPPAKKQKLDPDELDENTVGDADLYVAILKAADSAVKVQSWGCQRHRVNHSWTIDGKTVENTECLKTEFGNWTTTKDHSKWCVTTDQNRPWTCITDVNRSKSQFKRPGGGLCIISEDITNMFKGFIGSENDCKNKNKRGLDSNPDSDPDCDPESDCDPDSDPDCDPESDSD